MRTAWINLEREFEAANLEDCLDWFLALTLYARKDSNPQPFDP